MEVLNIVKVGIADMNIVKSPDVIRTTGLGSCVGVVLYDEVTATAGLLHILLPDSSAGRQSVLNPAKYGDTGVYALLELLKQEGVSPWRIKAKIAGGAQMFKVGPGDTMRIGPRNVESVKNELKRLSIPLIAEDTGGSNGRTIEFNPATGMLRIRTVNAGITEI